MPLYRRLPKRGFNNPSAKTFAEVNVGRIQQALDAKKLDASKTIDAAALKQAGVITAVRDGVRLLGKGELKTKITLSVTGATKTAVELVEKAGGKVEIIEKTVKPVTRKKPI